MNYERFAYRVPSCVSRFLLQKTWFTSFYHTHSAVTPVTSMHTCYAFCRKCIKLKYNCEVPCFRLHVACPKLFEGLGEILLHVQHLNIYPLSEFNFIHYVPILRIHFMNFEINFLKFLKFIFCAECWMMYKSISWNDLRLLFEICFDVGFNWSNRKKIINLSIINKVLNREIVRCKASSYIPKSKQLPLEWTVWSLAFGLSY